MIKFKLFLIGIFFAIGVNAQNFFWSHQGEYVPFEINWTTTVDNPCNSTPWTISENGLYLRYDIEDSEFPLDCGGSCDDVQSGTATAIITTGSDAVDMYLDFTGIGEEEDPRFEKIVFNLDNQDVAEGHAPGTIGDGSCAMGAIIANYLVSPPYSLNANSQYRFVVDFTTDDRLYHKDAYYEVFLRFEKK